MSGIYEYGKVRLVCKAYEREEKVKRAMRSNRPGTVPNLPIQPARC